ncbi:hypothetical protein ZIOFF_002351 [Zingiber officinale]|uniref:Uncharacterized protein n=1 Tax=Zingiber officinale TaxID=94328 RepID=A0A8J5I6T0_ZINOF|nr:hypothetical protein ZIOFF_002351 [Zingiber officinale]
MSVVGFDVGNESCIAAVARQRGIDVVLNDESKRETPAVVFLLPRLTEDIYCDPDPCDGSRRVMLDAATIAGLRPLRLFHETTATALTYGIYKTDLPENDQVNVAFVDVGHASMQVCIAGNKKRQLEILAHSFDWLLAACEKLKKVLSANPKAPLNIECLMDEKDVRGFIKREKFEQINIPILERVKGPLEKALTEEFFGKEPRRTMNASECVARGCALQCAILSPTFKLLEFQCKVPGLMAKLV